MAFFRNPPEVDKSLHLPCEMFILLNAQPIQLGRGLFLWGQSAELLVRSTICTPPRNSFISPPGRRPYGPEA
jgi:hypothetical protein